MRNGILSALRKSVGGVVLAAALLSVSPAEPGTAKPLFGLRKAPELGLSHCLTGEPIKLSDYKGKVVLVNFWATWCPPCQEEIPAFVSFKKQMATSDFEIIGVSLDDGGPKLVADFMKKSGITYPVAIDDGRTRAKFGGIRGIPTSFLLDKDGGIVQIFRGPVSEEDLHRAVMPLI